MNVPQGGFGSGYEFTGTNTGYFGSTTYMGMTLQGNSIMISRLDANPSFIYLGYGNTNSQAAYYRMYTDGAAPTSVNAQVYRDAGPNGNMVVQQTGTGGIYFQTGGSNSVAITDAGDMTQWAPGTISSGAGFKVAGTAGGIFVPIAPVTLIDTASSSWANVTKTAASYTFDIQSNGNALPAGALAVVVFLQGYWTTAANGSICALYTKGVGTAVGAIRALAANITSDAQIIVPVDANGQFTATITGTLNGGYLRAIGYYL